MGLKLEYDLTKPKCNRQPFKQKFCFKVEKVTQVGKLGASMGKESVTLVSPLL
jgi:hypothetical protein